MKRTLKEAQERPCIQISRGGAATRGPDQVEREHKKAVAASHVDDFLLLLLALLSVLLKPAAI